MLPFTRRELLQRTATGLGTLGLAAVLADAGLLAADTSTKAVNPLAPKLPHFPPRAKHVIHLFMNGGPSQVDTFDPKPELTKRNGQKPPMGLLKTERSTSGLMKSPFKFAKYGQSGLEISELFPNVAKCADDLCVIRSMHTNIPNHEPSLLMMTSGRDAADPAVDGVVAAIRPRHREPEPARLRRLLPRQARRRPAAVEQQLPARHLPGHAHQQLVDRPEEGHSARQQFRPRPRFPARADGPTEATQRDAPGAER